MIRYPGFQLPPRLHDDRKRALKLSWLTLLFLTTLIIPLALLSESSQVVKAAWLEDMISCVPPIVILITYRLQDRLPSTWYPHGHFASVGVGYLINAVALSALGLYLIVDAAMGLGRGELPTLGSLELMGHLVWEGWIIIALQAYSIAPALALGRAKLRVAHALHDKQLFADAEMNKADWLTAVASIVGIVAVGFGWWWADAAAAGIIGIDVFGDGISNLRSAIADLVGRTPRTLDGKHIDPLYDELLDTLRAMPWIDDVEIRMREEGALLAGVAHVVVAGTVPDLAERIEEICQRVHALSWRIVSFTVMPVPRIEAAIVAPDPPADAYPDR